MTKEELATMLNKRQYRNEITPEIEELAKKNNLLIVYGASDDLCEFRGAISDEFGCYDGGTIECKDLPKPIEAVWDPPKLNCSWIYKTNMPHTEFKIFEGDELYCIGIVIDLKDNSNVFCNEIPNTEVKHGKWSNEMVSKGDSEFGDFHFGFKCSECGAILNKTKYCGNCGAIMKGEQNV